MTSPRHTFRVISTNASAATPCWRAASVIQAGRRARMSARWSNWAAPASSANGMVAIPAEKSGACAPFFSSWWSRNQT